MREPRPGEQSLCCRPPGASQAQAFCGITSNKLVICWGSSDYGQLGNGIDTLVDGGANHDAGPACANGIHCTTSPLVITAPAIQFTKLSSGWNDSLALGSDGKVYAWGYNGNGQLGHVPLTNGDDGACINSVIDSVGPCNALPAVVNGLP